MELLKSSSHDPEAPLSSVCFQQKSPCMQKIRHDFLLHLPKVHSSGICNHRKSLKAKRKLPIASFTVIYIYIHCSNSSLTLNYFLLLEEMSITFTFHSLFYSLMIPLNNYSFSISYLYWVVIKYLSWLGIVGMQWWGTMLTLKEISEC